MSELLLRRRAAMAKTLPDGYTPLNYIENAVKATYYKDIRAAIQPGVDANGDFGFSIRFHTDVVGTSTGQTIIGAYDSGRIRLTVSLYKIDAVFSTGYVSISGTRYSPNFVVGDNTIVLRDHTLTVNGNTIATNVAEIQGLTRMPRLFMSNGGDNNPFNGKMYEAKIYKDGEIVRDMRPCINADNEYGMYDIVNGAFYGSINSYKFTGQ